MKLDHIGIVVESIDDTLKRLSEIMVVKVSDSYIDGNRGFKSQFLTVGEMKFEYLQSLADTSILCGFIKKNGEGLHHLSFEVDNIDKSVGRLKGKNFDVIGEVQQLTINDEIYKYIFIHPRSFNNILVELHEKIDNISHTEE